MAPNNDSRPPSGQSSRRGSPSRINTPPKSAIETLASLREDHPPHHPHTHGPPHQQHYYAYPPPPPHMYGMPGPPPSFDHGSWRGQGPYEPQYPGPQYGHPYPPYGPPPPGPYQFSGVTPYGAGPPNGSFDPPTAPHVPTVPSSSSSSDPSNSLGLSAITSPLPPHPPIPESEIIYTEDAATKVTDRIRRRCYNCYTSDTSTWRRSNLAVGKVLCNKCGLFERTHQRPRPEQFPHKRTSLGADGGPGGPGSPSAAYNNNNSNNNVPNPKSPLERFGGTPSGTRLKKPKLDHQATKEDSSHPPQHQPYYSANSASNSHPGSPGPTSFQQSQLEGNGDGREYYAGGAYGIPLHYNGYPGPVPSNGPNGGNSNGGMPPYEAHHPLPSTQYSLPLPPPPGSHGPPNGHGHTNGNGNGLHGPGSRGGAVPVTNLLNGVDGRGRESTANSGNGAGEREPSNIDPRLESQQAPGQAPEIQTESTAKTPKAKKAKAVSKTKPPKKQQQPASAPPAQQLSYPPPHTAQHPPPPPHSAYYPPPHAAHPQQPPSYATPHQQKHNLPIPRGLQDSPRSPVSPQSDSGSVYHSASEGGPGQHYHQFQQHGHPAHHSSHPSRAGTGPGTGGGVGKHGPTQSHMEIEPEEQDELTSDADELDGDEASDYHGSSPSSDEDDGSGAYRGSARRGAGGKGGKGSVATKATRSGGRSTRGGATLKRKRSTRRGGGDDDENEDGSE